MTLYVIHYLVCLVTYRLAVYHHYDMANSSLLPLSSMQILVKLFVFTIDITGLAGPYLPCVIVTDKFLWHPALAPLCLGAVVLIPACQCEL